MKNNETGEFELVLGNKQLLSGFAIVVILFGVFFTMGYIVGRNSTPPAKNADATIGLPAGGDIRLPSAVGEITPATPEPAKAGEMPAQTAPAQGAGETTQTQAPPPAPPASPAREAAPPAEQKAVAAPPVLEGGLYLQVRAVPRKDAEILMKTLQSRGFESTIGPSSKEGLFRVLVGPYKDIKAAGKAKGDLEVAGFHPVVAR